MSDYNIGALIGFAFMESLWALYCVLSRPEDAVILFGIVFFIVPLVITFATVERNNSREVMRV